MGYKENEIFYKDLDKQKVSDFRIDATVSSEKESTEKPQFSTKKEERVAPLFLILSVFT